MKPRFILPLLAILLLACSQEETQNKETVGTTIPIDENAIEKPIAKAVSIEEPSKKTLKECEPTKKEQPSPTFASLDDFFKANQEKAETYTINCNNDTVIKGEKGTEILVRKNVFVDTEGNEVTSPVSIALKEYYSMEDFILNGMHSTSNGQLLETGGMFHITASANGKEVFLKDGQSISFKIPTENKKESMQYFQGIETENGLDWVVSSQSSQESVTEQSILIASETSQSVTGVIDVNSAGQYYDKVFGFNWMKPKCKQCDEYFKEAITYPDYIKAERFTGNVIAKLTIDRDGSLYSISVEGSNEKSKELVEKAIKNYHYWNPPMVQGKVLAGAVELKFVFKYDSRFGKFAVFHPNYEELFEIMDEANYANAEETLQQLIAAEKNFKENLNTGSDETVTNFYGGQASSYFLEATKLGYINCDRFGNYPSASLTKVVVNTNSENTNVTLVFKNIRSIMTGYYKNGVCEFANVPVGEPITIMGIQEMGGTPQFAFEETTIKRGEDIDLQYSTITYAELKNQIERLN